MKLESWREMFPAAQAIYRAHPAGCCWHVVLDDHNIEPDSVAFCAKVAREKGCSMCLDLVPLITRASKTQIGKLYNELHHAISVEWHRKMEELQRRRKDVTHVRYVVRVASVEVPPSLRVELSETDGGRYIRPTVTGWSHHCTAIVGLTTLPLAEERCTRCTATRPDGLLPGIITGALPRT